MEAAAEKVRLALVMTGTPFEDKRVNFEQWMDLKPSAKYGQLPLLTVDGVQMAQSPALLRWVARKFGDGSLYPQDPDAMFEVESMLALSDDMAKAWGPALYMGMRPNMFGYPEDIKPEDKEALVKTLRERFLAESLPKFMGMFTAQLEKTGAFLCGDKVTIADLQLLPQLRYFTRGVADFVPADSLAPYPVVIGWIDRMLAVPEIKAWYDSKK
uniref:Glutathione transferase n=1 Tax=Eutreptiella gymnastica TaxID=73025 RepID=A0A6T1R809_9EUGL